MEKVEIFFLFFFPSGGNVLLPPATSPCQGTKQILTVRATESTQEWTNPKRAEEQKILWHSKHHFREQEESIASKCQNEAI